MQNKNSHISDLTQGNPAGVIFRFYLPLLSTNMLQQFYNMVDSIIVGKGLGDNALAAVGNMAPLSYLIIGCCMGLAHGFGIPIANSFGAKDYGRLKKNVAAAVVLSVIISAIASTLSVVFLRRILIMMQVAPVIISDSLKYGYFIFGGIAVTMCYNLASSILRALGDSRTPFTAILVSTVTNIVLDILLVLVFDCGVAGAAAATIIAQLVSSLICLRRLAMTPIVHPRREDFRLSRAVTGELLRNGVPMSIMNSITAAGCMVVQYFINGMGVVYTAVYSICVRFDNFFMQPAIALGSAVSSFVSQNYGAGRIDRIKKGVRIGMLYAMISYAIFGILMIIFPRQLASLMLTGEEHLSLAVTFLPITGFALWVVDLIFIYRSACQGLGKPLIPMISGIVEMLMRISVIVIFLAPYGFKAAAWAEAAAWTGAMLMNLGAYIVHIHRLEKTTLQT